MRIATWNVNSVRLRRRAIGAFVRRHAPDVLCLQETKVEDALFPGEYFERLGYVHRAIFGQKGYNGVAVLSRLPLSKVRSRRWCGREDRRHLEATLPNGVEVHNVYAPAGGPLPDPERNPNFAYKLRFYEELTRWLRRRRRGSERLVLVGDLNVAPLPTDVWSHEKLRRVVTHTEVEVEAMNRLRASLDWVDAVRLFVPESEKVFTWWSYRAPHWRRANKGRRLDHVWVTPSLADAVRSARVVTAVRGWKLPSDHAPVLVEVGETAIRR